MGAFTATAANPMLDFLVGKATATTGTRYISTFNGDPQGAGVENIATLTGSANRTNLTAAFSNAAAASSTANASIVTFFTTAAGTGAVAFWDEYD